MMRKTTSRPVARKPKKPRQVRTLTHEEASRKNIPTAEYQAVMVKDDQNPIERETYTLDSGGF